MMVQQVAFVVAHAIAGESNGDFLEVVTSWTQSDAVASDT